MSRKHKRSPLRLTHRWVGALIAVLVLVVAASGIVLQHPQWLGPVPNPPLCLAADPVEPGHLLRGSHWGVQESADGGATWREVPMLAPPSDVVRIVFAPGGAETRMVYALGNRSAVVSADGGRVWQELAMPSDERLFGARLLDLAAAGDGSLRLLTSVGQFDRNAAGAWTAAEPEFVPGRDRHRWVHDLHTGHLFGLAGRRAAEGAAWGLIVLTLSGLVLCRRNGRGRK